MYKYLLGKYPEKSPGLPFLKVKLFNDRKTNIGKKMNKSALDLSRDTELLVLGNNYLSQKSKNINNKKITIFRQNPEEGKLISISNNKPNKENKNQHITNKKKRTHHTLSENFLIQAKNEYLIQRLNKITKEKNKNMKKIMKTSALNFESNKTNNINTKKYQINYKNRRNDNRTQRTNTTNMLNKTSKNEKLLFEKLFFNKKMENNTYRNINKLSSLLSDTTKNSIMLNMDIKNYSQDASFKNFKKNVLDKSLKQIKSQDDITQEPINFRKIFDKINNVLNRPMKQVRVKVNKKYKMIWVKKSTANLISFGQVSKSINDERFYRERKRITESYRNYEREAGIYIKKSESERQNYRNEVFYKNMKKIDELLTTNNQLIKDIMKKKYPH